METKIMILLLFVCILFVLACNRINDPHSEDVFSINPVDLTELKVYSPSYQQIITPGSILKIKWYFPENVDFVQIALYRKDSRTEIITIKTPNTGYYEWKIPEDFRNSVHYRINISVYNTPVINKFSEYFFIQKPAATYTGEEVI